MSPSMNLIGRLLRPLRADLDRSPLAGSGFDAPDSLVVTSPAFADGAPMPLSSAGRGVGDDISPPLQWTGIPESTAQLVLLLEDVDVPLRAPLLHSVAVIEPDIRGLDAGAFRDSTAGLRIVPTMLGKHGYSGPRPIPGHGPHRYRFHLLALDRTVPQDVTTAKALLATADGHVLARGTLTGTYER